MFLTELGQLPPADPSLPLEQLTEGARRRRSGSTLATTADLKMAAGATH